MFFHCAFLVLLVAAGSSTPTPKSTVDIFPLSTVKSTLSIGIPHTTKPPQAPTPSSWSIPPALHDKRWIWTTHTTLQTAASASHENENEDVSAFELPHPMLPSPPSASSPSPTSAGHKFNVPRTFLIGQLLRTVYAAHLLPRHEPLVTSPPNRTTSAASQTSFDIHSPLSTTSYPSRPRPLCPDKHQNCGSSICYDPMVRWCCPGERNVCSIGDVCAEGKGVGEGRGPVYGCGPPDVTDGLDSRISTATATVSGTGNVGVSTTLATTTSQTAGTREGSARPTANAGRRVCVPSMLRQIVALVHSVRAFTILAPLRLECCGNICCFQGEVCTRSSDGAKCWPAATRRGVMGIEAARAEQDGMVHVAESPGQVGSDYVRKGGGGGHAGGGGHRSGVRPGAGAPGGGNHSGSPARPVVPTMLYLFLLFISFAVTSFPSSSSHPPLTGNTQTHANSKEYRQTRWSPHKRWSCHSPNKNCGVKGCYDPSTQPCCMHASGLNNLCAADKGESCCGERCCPNDTECRWDSNVKAYLCYPAGSF